MCQCENLSITLEITHEYNPNPDFPLRHEKIKYLLFTSSISQGFKVAKCVHISLIPVDIKILKFSSFLENFLFIICKPV